MRRGDTLWDIASRAAGTSDSDRVREFTLQLYNLNRDVVGPNPNLILPGQVLRLPDDLQR